MDGSMLVHEFDHEFAQTRTALERVPEDKYDWKPHEKSYSVYELASHLAWIPHWMGPTLDVDLLDLDEPMERPEAKDRAEMLAQFDEGVKVAREKLANASADKLQEMWSMKYGGEIAMSMPKGAVVRSFIMNHNVHHRAQLGVYLRLLGIPVPGHYGPSADEMETQGEGA